MKIKIQQQPGLRKQVTVSTFADRLSNISCEKGVLLLFVPQMNFEDTVLNEIRQKPIP